MTDCIVFSDQELINRLHQTDQAAFAEIYNRYWEKMLTIAWNHTKDRFLAEDIVHEVFISLWDLKSHIPISNLGGFLSTKIKFAVFENYRKQQRRNKLAEINFNYSEISLEEEKWDALFLQEYINGLVEELPEKCRLVFKYSRNSGMKNAEIASQMNISEKGVEANLTRALKIIRGNLETTGILLVVSRELLNLLKL